MTVPRSPVALVLGWMLLTAGCGESAMEGEAPPVAAGQTAAEAPPAAPALQVPPSDPDAPTTQTDTFTSTAPEWSAKTIMGLEPVAPMRTGKTPFALPATPEVERTLETLKAVVQKHGGDPDNPWAISHALVAMGPEFRLNNDQLAVDWLFSEYAEEFTVGEGDAAVTLIRFPAKRGDLAVEPHTALMLKALTEAGVSPDRPVVVNGNPHTLADLYRGVLLQSYLVPATNKASFQSPNDVPWALQALAAWAPPGQPLRWTAVDGTPMTLEDLTVFAGSVLMTETQELFKAMEAGADFQKRGQGIFKYTCGGAHLLQGVAYANARGNGTELLQMGLMGQILLMYYRLPRELQQLDALMQRAPQHVMLLLVQRLKFVGHFLESMHKMAAMRYYTPGENQKVALAGAAQQMVLLVDGIDKQGIFDAMDDLRSSNPQLYLDLIGDSAHAINGLELALGRKPVAY